MNDLRHKSQASCVQLPLIRATNLIKQLIRRSATKCMMVTWPDCTHLVEGSFFRARSKTQVSSTLIALSGLPATRVLLALYAAKLCSLGILTVSWTHAVLSSCARPTYAFESDILGCLLHNSLFALYAAKLCSLGILTANHTHAVWSSRAEATILLNFYMVQSVDSASRHCLGV